METLAYLHHACANEAPDDLSTLPASSSLNGLKLSGAAYPKILSVLVGVIILTTATAAMALQRGDRGAEVSQLQRQLAAAGCYDGPITDFFGELTEQGVIECQRRFGLVQDGIAGPATLAAISRGGIGGPADPVPSDGTLRLNSSGQAVANVQSRLAQLRYYNGTVDGFFGPQTQAAVIQFQRDRGLVPDGVVGSEVYRALGLASVPNNPPSGLGLEFGSQGSDVERLQLRLKDLGYFTETATGFYGSVTRDAVARFQQDNRLPATGVADAQTLGLLGFNIGGSSDPVNRYLVVIPKQDNSTLGRVRQLIPSAFLSSSRLGDYVQAGAYPTLEAANTQTALLRAQGLDARVTYARN